MIYRWTLSSLSLLLAFAAAACGPPPPIGSAVQSLAAGEIALPTPAWVIPSGAVLACGGVGISTVIHGDPADPRVAWLITDTGARIDAVWLAGYGARFVPTIEVLDAAGDVVLREGNPVTGGCPAADPNVLFLIPPFNQGETTRGVAQMASLDTTMSSSLRAPLSKPW